MLKSKLITIYIIIFIFINSILLAGIKLKDFRFFDRDYVYEGTACIYENNLRKKSNFKKDDVLVTLSKNYKGNLILKKINVTELKQGDLLLHGQLIFKEKEKMEIVKKVDYEYGKIAGQIIEYDNKRIKKIENIIDGKKDGFVIEDDSSGGKRIKYFKKGVKQYDKRKEK